MPQFEFCAIKANKEKATDKIDDNIPPKPLWFLGAVHKTRMSTAGLERFPSECGGYAYQQ